MDNHPLFYSWEKVINTSDPIDLTGQRFGMLTVLDVSKDICIDPKTGWKRKKWDCQCDCGKIIKRTTSDILRRKDAIQSCGCYKSVYPKLIFTTHGGTVGGTKGQKPERLYTVYAGIKARCTNPNNKYYYAYGEKGITMCEEWANDYSKFREWAYGNGYDENAPTQQCTIDRIDLDKGYCPENCRWVPASVQANNKSNNRILEFHGEKHTVKEWADITGLSQSTIDGRINRYGWSTEDALTLPLYTKTKNKYGEDLIHGTSTQSKQD